MFRADLPAAIEWQCNVCGDEGVISGWEESPFDLRLPGNHTRNGPNHEIFLSDELAGALRELTLLDVECERLVYRMRSSGEDNILEASADELDELLGFVAADANHEINPNRRRRLDRAFAVLSDALGTWESGGGSDSSDSAHRSSGEPGPDARDITGRWNIVEMDLWDSEALDLVAPAFIEFSSDHRGSFGFIAVTGWIDWRISDVDRFDVEFSWDGNDEGGHITGRGWATLGDAEALHGHLYFHLGDDSGFRAERFRK
ncbi:MAG TPA: hypothetical protein VNF07_03150 [Acidimicrobiales bacterium]|nr:hypothetical protein [Acidimicrobiales bacterium]